MSKLTIHNLEASVENKKILNKLNLEVSSSEIHVIMGPNGAGKSTLSQAIMGYPKYKVDAGKIILDGEDITNMPVDKRAKKGLFLSTQYPAEIPGISNTDFLKTATKAISDENESLIKFIRRLEKNIDDLDMPKDMTSRSLNEGFSGGEKKKNEILQLKMLKPKIAILDEIDSGLDVDALTVVGENLKKEMQENTDLGLLIITHYNRLLKYIEPTHVHILVNGKIVKSGDKSLAQKIEKEGFKEYLDTPENKVTTTCPGSGVKNEQ